MNFRISYQENFYLQCINPLSDHTLTIVTLLMIKITILFFHQRLESLQYNAALAITGAIGDTSKEKLFNQLRLESLQNMWWYGKLSLLYKLVANRSPSYLFNVIPRKNTSPPTRGSDNIPLLCTKDKFFQNNYFPVTIKKWNRLDIDIRKLDNISIFKKRILSFIRRLPNKFSNFYNPQELKPLARL